ncbi:SpoIIE family protein phosphatase [Echinicola jeungdonensis]|uniref:GAF domain-containing SpoIIE family protein phosphatase n=1 Tax=Echinicola jeungdonensis TaxID=709343 RepID=A0ABV5J1R2_9BACT|nr:GAF domain-containing SpoIIE family protein phosphatase [Echinicola jeungdonensis]MDN3668590.1 SpoIIE family protein phosphatase [Echinicola jeungdonensis]
MIRFPNINIGKIVLLVAVLTWLAMLFVDLLRLFGSINQMNQGIAPEVTWTLEIIFFFLVYIFYNNIINKSENNNFVQLIWRAASIGLMATGISLLIHFFYYLLGSSRLSTDPLLRNFFYHINFGTTSIFLICATLLWKHLILYQKNKNVVQQWQIYEVMLLVSMFFIYFNKNTFDFTFLFGLLFLLIFGIIISANLKWIPYLTFKDKWKSILFLAIILICTFFLFIQLLSYSESGFILVNLMDNLFLLGLFGFVFIYSLFSFLVTLFNLPTSSVFEQKLTEAINFQKLSQSIQPGQNESQVLDILMDSCMSAAYVDAAWLEIMGEDGNIEIQHQRFISNKDRKETKKIIQKTKLFSEYLNNTAQNTPEYLSGTISHDTFKSALVVPIRVNKNLLGNIYLLKEIKNGFNKEMLNIILTFVGQASISVENYRLLNEAIRNERYKEELKIAQRVQRSLLPSTLHHDDSFEIVGFSEAADEVGGDYYETFQFSDHQFALIIGDVSGKGTSAAFNMSQMKGIFHSLVQMELSPVDFLDKANYALSSCLAKNHFITTTYYILDTRNKKLTFSRAGHCPTLYFNIKTQEASFLSVGGLGLGILRNEKYRNYLEEKTLPYQEGDILVMYTDGIIESKNENKEEFGYDRLKEIINQNHNLSAQLIKEKIIQSVYDFVGKSALPDDDYSLLVLKFQNKH